MTINPASPGNALPGRLGDFDRRLVELQRQIAALGNVSLQKKLNLADLTSPAAARVSLGVATNGYVAQLTSQAAFTNTAAEQTAWTAANLPAASLSAGVTLLHVFGGGSVDVINTTGGTMKTKIKVNGTLVASVDPILAQQTSGALSAIPYFFDLWLYVDATGGGGQVTVVGGSLIIANASATNQPRPVLQQTSVSLTGGLQVSMTLTMTVANAGNTFRLTRAGVLQAS